MIAERALARAVLYSMDDTTPGGITRKQIAPVSVWRHWGTIAAWVAFGAFCAVLAFAWIVR